VNRSSSFLVDLVVLLCIPQVDMGSWYFTEGIWVLLEDKQFSSREHCNVPTLGHHHSAEIYDDQSSQMDVIASTGVFERHCGVQLGLIIISHHYEPFHTGWLWFRCIPMISMILFILRYKLIEITEEVILGTLLGGTS
jgi:hypothetical protein